jgi:hypothetical protein
MLIVIMWRITFMGMHIITFAIIADRTVTAAAA